MLRDRFCCGFTNIHGVEYGLSPTGLTPTHSGDRIMSTQAEAQDVFSKIEKKLLGNRLVTGMEIAVLQKDGVYTDDVCVRVLVNSDKATHEQLGIPKEMDGVMIEVRFSVIELY